MKKFIVLSLLSVLTLLFVGCAPRNTQPDDTVGVDTGDNEEVVDTTDDEPNEDENEEYVLIDWNEAECEDFFEETVAPYDAFGFDGEVDFNDDDLEDIFADYETGSELFGDIEVWYVSWTVLSGVSLRGSTVFYNDANPLERAVMVGDAASLYQFYRLQDITAANTPTGGVWENRDDSDFFDDYITTAYTESAWTGCLYRLPVQDSLCDYLYVNSMPENTELVLNCIAATDDRVYHVSSSMQEVAEGGDTENADLMNNFTMRLFTLINKDPQRNEDEDSAEE